MTQKVKDYAEQLAEVHRENATGVCFVGDYYQAGDSPRPFLQRQQCFSCGRQYHIGNMHAEPPSYLNLAPDVCRGCGASRMVVAEQIE